MKFTPSIWAVLLAQLSCGCHRYERSSLADVVPSTKVQSWISPKDLPDVTERASRGNLACMVMLARYYLDSANDREAGIRWLRAAAIEGDRASKWTISFYLLRSADAGEQVEGMKWLRAAAKDGDEMAIRELRRREKELGQAPEPIPMRRNSSS